MMDRCPSYLKGSAITYEDSSHHDQRSFVDYLHSWGGAWLWDGLVIPDDPAWIADLMRDGTLLCA